MAAQDARGVLAAQEFGGVEEVELVHQALVEEGAQGFGAAFYQDALHLAPAQKFQ